MYDQLLTELPEILRRADVLKRWVSHSVQHLPDGRIRIDMQAVVGVDEYAHTLPTGVVLDDAEVQLTLVSGEEFGLDTITECNGQVVIRGLDRQANVLTFAMHLDRHDPKQSSNELHSTYHWQVGGDKIASCTFGSVVHLQGPRFPSPPLDPMLFIDFVLGHFNGTKRASLMSEAAFVRYRRLLHQSQTLFVMPFFQSILATLQADPLEPNALWAGLC